MQENSRYLGKIGAVLLVFLAVGLGSRPYITPSEARYIEIPRQMLVLGDWLTPHINGVPYFEKPPLFYWMQAAVMQFGGAGEFSGRLATMLVVIATALVTFSIAQNLYGRRAGLLSVLVLSTSLLGYGLSRIVMLDAPVTLFLTFALGAFLIAQNTNDSKKQRCLYHVMYISAALAMLTKGLLGIVIPGLVIGAWIVLTRKWKLLASVRLVSGLLIFVAIAAPWHVLMQMQHPEFFNFYFIHEHFTRYLSDGHRRTAPWWFFIAVTFAGLVPWVFFAWGALGQAFKNRADDKTLFLLLWILLPLIFFSTSHSKLVPYIFPIFPPLAIIIGHYLAALWEKEKWQRIIKAIALVIVGIEMAANFIAPRFDSRTIKPLADELNKTLKADDIVVAYESYWQDLPVYLNRNVMVAGWQGELKFGVDNFPQTHGWMVSNSEFWTRCAEAKNEVYVFIKKGEEASLPSDSNCHLQEVMAYGKTMLLKKEKK
ncbi:MAG: glycosyltransferase family 39 protein [Alphaproteobacteria bacterium]|nr:glycosyltransferase family 39 protein [Alphaproteobacteria bacterium]